MSQQEANPINVVVVGAGPAGLLSTILILHRNRNKKSKNYRITLIDPGNDYGKLDEDGLNRARSWMIGLSYHGLDAIRTVPGLYENYILGLGVNITKVIFGLSKTKKFVFDIKDLPDDADRISSFTVDRNYICAALSRYLIDQHEKNNDDDYNPMYNTRALYVDSENKCVVTRSTISNNKHDDKHISYDVLLGCDGIRSIVRNAFIMNHRDFEFDLKGTFSYGKSVHVPCPSNVDEGTFMFINEALPGWGSFILPETGRMLNVALGTALSNTCPSELQSNDPAVIAKYFRDHWHAFDLSEESAMIIGRQWVDQKKWNTISQVHCNFYYSHVLNALLMGDAAHATSPQIGQGMNIALADAAVLDQLLDAHNDDWNVVLPNFSKERVKEGNALTDLSFYTFSLDTKQQLLLLLKQNMRRVLNKHLPWLFDPDPMTEVALGMKLSEAYRRMSKFGVIQKVRRVNDAIIRTHFEKEVGMIGNGKNDDICSNTQRLVRILSYGLVPAAAACAVTFFYRVRK